MWCITTLITSDNYYKQYVPLFEYTIKKAIPDADGKVFILEELFPGYPKSSVNALRFHIPAEHFKGYKWPFLVMVTLNLFSILFLSLGIFIFLAFLISLF